MLSRFALGWCLLILCSCGQQQTSGGEQPKDASPIHVTSIAAPELELGTADFSIRQTGENTYELSAQNAEELKGVLVELEFDPALGEPELVITGDDLAGSVALVQASGPGTAQLGVILPNYDKRAGMTGSLSIATFTFGNAEQVVQRQPSANITQSNFTWPRVDRANHRLTWALQFKGDFDQNCEVNISDLAPLAREFGQVAAEPQNGFEFHSVQSVVDGDQNGAITISDIGTIAANFGHQIDHFQFGGDDHAGGALQSADFALSDLTGDGAIQRRWLDVTYPDMKRGYYYHVGIVLADGSPYPPPPDNQPVTTLSAGQGIYGVDEPADFQPEYYDDDRGLNYDSASKEVSWSLGMRSDGDQNGRITITDLSPIALYFGTSGPYPLGSRSWLVDGDANGEVNIDDLVPLVYRANIASDGTEAFYSTSAEGPPTDRFADFGHPLVGTPINHGTGIAALTVDLPSGSWIWARATLGNFTGPACGIQQIP